MASTAFNFGSGIDIDVIGSLVAPAGRANRIWVKTDVKITSWVISTVQPASPTSGMLWIGNGKYNSTDILVNHKNRIELFPSGVMQYVNGSWSRLYAYLYRDGWKAISIVDFYNLGDENTSLTGGWTIGNAATANWSKGSNCIYADYLGTANVQGGARTTNKIDVTEFNRLCFEVNISSKFENRPAVFGLASSDNLIDAYLGSSYIAYNTCDTSGTYYLDISGISGSYYIKCGGPFKGSISKFYAEV